jgi:hypothetical protein
MGVAEQVFSRGLSGGFALAVGAALLSRFLGRCLGSLSVLD